VVLVDTSVWIDVFRDSTGRKRLILEKVASSDDIILTPFTELELLQGCRNEEEWSLLFSYLKCQEYVEPDRETWSSAARIYFELRRRGKTVQSPIDCCIAQLAIENQHLLLHRDKDFETIAAIRPLQQRYLKW
jgi:predicted nucleic acid-binding protein